MRRKLDVSADQDGLVSPFPGSGVWFFLPCFTSVYLWYINHPSWGTGVYTHYCLVPLLLLPSVSRYHTRLWQHLLPTLICAAGLRDYLSLGLAHSRNLLRLSPLNAANTPCREVHIFIDCEMTRILHTQPARGAHCFEGKVLVLPYITYCWKHS